VLEITPVTNTVTVGPHDALEVREITAIRPTWTGDRPATPWRGHVQLRAHGQPLPATCVVGADGLLVIMDTAAAGVAPGQAAVLYDGTRVVGSATISATS
jgi:tRNA-specific 2-thiouridylase